MNPEKKMNRNYIWWFEWTSDKPVHDPWFDAKCMVSWRPLEKGKVYTISLMPTKWSDKSYFFRVLKEERDKLSEKEKNTYESSIIDYTEVVKNM